jgi:hypothetical protein
MSYHESTSRQMNIRARAARFRSHVPRCLNTSGDTALLEPVDGAAGADRVSRTFGRGLEERAASRHLPTIKFKLLLVRAGASGHLLSLHLGWVSE